MQNQDQFNYYIDSFKHYQTSHNPSATSLPIEANQINSIKVEEILEKNYAKDNQASFQESKQTKVQKVSKNWKAVNKRLFQKPAQKPLSQYRNRFFNSEKDISKGEQFQQIQEFLYNKQMSGQQIKLKLESLDEQDLLSTTNDPDKNQINTLLKAAKTDRAESYVHGSRMKGLNDDYKKQYGISSVTPRQVFKINSYNKKIATNKNYQQIEEGQQKNLRISLKDVNLVKNSGCIDKLIQIQAHGNPQSACNDLLQQQKQIRLNRNSNTTTQKSQQTNISSVQYTNQSNTQRPKSAYQRIEKPIEKQQIYDRILRNIKQMTSKQEGECQFQLTENQDSRYLNTEHLSVDSNDTSSLDYNDYLISMQYTQRQPQLYIQKKVQIQPKLNLEGVSQDRFQTLLQKSQGFFGQQGNTSTPSQKFQIKGVKQQLRRRDSFGSNNQANQQINLNILNQQIQTSYIDNNPESPRFYKLFKKQGTDVFAESAGNTQEVLDPKFQTQTTEHQDQSNQILSPEIDIAPSLEIQSNTIRYKDNVLQQLSQNASKKSIKQMAVNSPQNYDSNMTSAQQKLYLLSKQRETHYSYLSSVDSPSP